MPKPPSGSRRFSLTISGLVLAVGLLFLWGFNFTLEATNTMPFCTSCHTMGTNYEEYKASLHYKNASGVQATCADCHVPKPPGPKLLAKVIAVKDVFHEVAGTIDTPEKFEARRWYMANLVWERMEANDSRECRSCHAFENMDLSEQGRSARSRHAAAEDKGQTCIECHRGIVHHEPDEPDEVYMSKATDADAT